ncbi:hypothetical protein BDP55DRAFT_699444 [Colletotrichum godetiae]|uniref:PD-(D/E)XK nuclease-like domain-containing protein n=1 Tax=Colletotrichum godetiae TaxID=1209918 RepID=A0AAJ0A7P6_9PEZI|nr:uncharacterized protein BDP55DRAFT_699444 [Colletotrichum godetiae]KAK1656591.1 hypothetical protein BDP55DRAFT_699444 [Colletotrichum godetiae]
MSAPIPNLDDTPTRFVRNWLSSLPYNIDEPSTTDFEAGPPALQNRTRKRHRILTPPDSVNMAPSSPLKRSQLGDESHSISTSDASSQLSGSSTGSRSPTKRRRRTDRNPHRVRHFDMSANAPSSLREIWKRIREYSRGVGENIDEAKKICPDMEEIRYSLYFDDASVNTTDGLSRRVLGPTPTTQQVTEMVSRAKMCRDYEFDEAGWNTSLHHHVINLAVPEFYQATGKLVYMIPCTSANTLPDLVQTSAFRKVDFCLCIEPTGAAAQAINRLVLTETPSINHTEYGALKTRPIVLSIETKLQGEGLSVAEAQLLTWHASQWRMLDRLMAGTVPRMPLIDFLPGIIVQGNDWLFVASTRDGDEVTLWSNQMIGSTSEPLGVYQIVCVLQFLISWIEDVYWPWFQQAVLCLHPEPV